ncbi:hypothetical protein [Polaromonas sp. CG_23.6]|uniref:hypothetical protein n=1 Tax=Polaromonas sp. CG_23.6 TaxID=2760709 RepID=UPI002473BB2B|nr:hypothetical protein [Polaromonas sp. CG_23.6]MDH6186241.1 hypothetical protein [Polaromonas sp. CG_23.6]
MENTEPTRSQLIEAALTTLPETVANVTLHLWERLAPQLISIIGEGGFKPLYTRSLRLASSLHPWIAPDLTKSAIQERFTHLQAVLSQQDAAVARLGSLALFTIFLDVLASLIGEELTTHLLHSAWNDKTFDTSAKDFPK